MGQFMKLFFSRGGESGAEQRGGGPKLPGLCCHVVGVGDWGWGRGAKAVQWQKTTMKVQKNHIWKSSESRSTSSQGQLEKKPNWAPPSNILKVFCNGAVVLPNALIMQIESHHIPA